MAFGVLRRREDGALLVLEARWGLGGRGRRKQRADTHPSHCRLPPSPSSQTPAFFQ